MSDDTSNRPSRTAERPHDVTDPLLWQLAIDVLSAHEPDDEGQCRNLQCAGQSWPCAARTGAEHSLRLARSTPDSVKRTTDGDDSDDVGAGRPGEPAVPASPGAGTLARQRRIEGRRRPPRRRDGGPARGTGTRADSTTHTNARPVTRPSVRVSSVRG